MIPENLAITVETLCKAATKNDTNFILFLLEQLVPGYQPKNLESYAAANISSNTSVRILAQVKP